VVGQVTNGGSGELLAGQLTGVGSGDLVVVQVSRWRVS
jgi:hypothetical protein